MAIINFIIFLLCFALANCQGNQYKWKIGENRIEKLNNETIHAHRQRGLRSMSKPRKLRANSDVQDVDVVKRPNDEIKVNDGILKWSGVGYEFAGIVMQGSFTSVSAEMSVFKPEPVQNNHSSSMYIFIESGSGANLNQIQAGWTVHPDRFHDNEPHLYAKFTGDNNKVCFNTDCHDYRELNKKLLGAPVQPITRVGHYPFYTIQLSFIQNLTSGRWHLRSSTFGHMGFWSGESFSSLKGAATTIRIGGEVYTPNWSHSSPPMGSGIFQNSNTATTCSFHNIKVNKDSDPQNPQTVESRCYFVAGVGRSAQIDGYGFFVGGTGGEDKRKCYY